MRHRLFTLLLFALPAVQTYGDDISPKLKRWLKPQSWKRDVTQPIVSLGKPGEFDDRHLFAPCVALEKGRYRLWYSGSRGVVAKRVFSLGLAFGKDGRKFAKHNSNPVFRFGDGKHSVLTATLLRKPDGAVLRENGKLRMWFSSTHFAGGTGKHTLHESSSRDGIKWDAPSKPQLEGVYAPTIIKDGKRYRMWFTDVSGKTWVISQAESLDGRAWKVTHRGVVKIDQKWEMSRLFYPTVLKIDGVYLLWYGSYWSAKRSKTALGFAVSTDGLSWKKHPSNPVFRPDPKRAWESHYTTSQSVLRLSDGSFRIWYASRKKPPFVNKYFAIGTATWAGPRR